ncbi:hypothetical protein Fleli_2043 [Bernardetia litoralis DSM 6794]|uniref:Uncharacterized protein n=1 Tax=Bernardetia litoralis (strain ATCC 23117 / DSM 6794 / NBRC 15988 / NCIMB 1366 / Fx l1 / Sio-4) TaxID=880071 RepID=I4AKE2_BERLS|nr:hypothetical protein [Bernardetia litoralis]AFM04427.1 hypothetical protein Fleli_2043 [Bernardetia litoralis DSM 6794]
MLHTHHLDTTNHSDFLNQERIDPITGEKIEEGHTIVICAACKSAFFIESWEYLGNEHCNQEKTLSQIPIAKSLQLIAKPLEYLPFLFRKGKYFINRNNDEGFDFVAKSLLFGAGIIGYLVILITIAVFIGNFTGIWQLVMAFLAISIWGSNKLLKPYYTGKREFSSISSRRATYLAVNMKKQAIEYKRNKKKDSIAFEKIKHINYYFDYIPHSECGQYLQQVISLEIATTDHKKINFYAFLHKNEIPHWSNFLEELPYSISVLNQK